MGNRKPYVHRLLYFRGGGGGGGERGVMGNRKSHRPLLTGKERRIAGGSNIIIVLSVSGRVVPCPVSLVSENRLSDTGSE